MVMDQNNIELFIKFLLRNKALDHIQKREVSKLLARDASYIQNITNPQPKSGDKLDPTPVTTLTENVKDQDTSEGTVINEPYKPTIIDTETIYRFLHLFGEKEALKYTTHIWDKSNEQEGFIYENFDAFKKQYPSLRYHITSGDTEQVTEKLDKGLLDFAVICEPPDSLKYEYVEFPDTDIWGAVMRADHPLAANESVTADDLAGLPLFCSEQSWNYEIAGWAGSRHKDLRLEGSFRLSYNGSMFALEGLGLLLTFRGLINCSKESGLVFRPLHPRQETHLYLIWNRYQALTPMASKFRDQVMRAFSR